MPQGMKNRIKFFPKWFLTIKCLLRYKGKYA